ncbi:unnamed protein product, partial [Brachionus calyciflorus]
IRLKLIKEIKRSINQTRNSMKFSDSRHDSIYDDFENSIVDSLSELSIASTLQLNPNSQEVINRTINDVISTYLWSTDSLISRQPKFNESLKKLEKYERQIKTGWDTPEQKKKEDRLSSNKVSIPTLDFSAFSEKDAQNKSDEQINKKEKTSWSKQKSQENIFSIKPDSNKISNDIKPKSFDTKNDKQTHVIIKHDIENLLRELKLITKTQETSEYYSQENESKLGKQDFEKLSFMASNLRDLLSRLLEKRKLAKRNIVVEKMTREEIQSEKVDTQKELLAFEEKHGRPQNKLEKDLMRPLYDHYRKVKRILSKYTSGKGVGDQNNEENLAGDDEEMNNFRENKPFANLQSLSLNELTKEKDMATMEKTKLKELIKKYEIDFVKSTGRALTKEDREYHKEEFEKYKILKAKLKLIEALIEKYETNHFSKAK